MRSALMPPLAVLILGPFSVFASPGTDKGRPRVSECAAFLTPPQPIQRTQQEIYSIELSHAGFVYTKATQFQHLQDGVYVFLLTDKGEWLIAPRYEPKMYLESSKGLATHKSLLSMYELTTGAPVHEVLASGEILIFNHRIEELSNRSGNFRGDERHLEFALAVLRGMGVNVSPKLKFTVFAGDEAPRLAHTFQDRSYDEFQLEIRAKIEADEKASAYLRLFRRLSHLFAEAFPNLSGSEQMNSAVLMIRKGAKITGHYEGMMYLTYPITRIFTADRLAVGLTGALSGDLPNWMPVQIENFVVGYDTTHSRRLRNDLVAHLRRVAHEFRAM